jgi:hypothetical protein
LSEILVLREHDGGEIGVAFGDVLSSDGWEVSALLLITSEEGGASAAKREKAERSNKKTERSMNLQRAELLEKSV